MTITLKRMEQLEDLLVLRLYPLKRFMAQRCARLSEEEGFDEEEYVHEAKKLIRLQALIYRIQNRIYPQGKSPLQIWSEGPDDAPLPATF